MTEPHGHGPPHQLGRPPLPPPDRPTEGPDPLTEEPADLPSAGLAGLPPEPTSGRPPQGPPGARVFSLEGRRAPGLYLVAWILSIGGLVLTLLIGPMAGSETARLVLIGLGVLIVALGLSAGAGSQVLERRDRHPARYRGPAPLLVFGVYYFALSFIGLLLIGSGLADPDDPAGFLVIGTVQAIGYVVVVWLFAVRTGTLSWPDMGWPTWGGRELGQTLRAIGSAVVVMLPTTFGLLILGGIIATILDVEAPDVVPEPDTTLAALGIAVAAIFIVPIGEELFFRGFSVTAWGRDLGPRPALIRSAVFFALVHIANITTSSFGEGAAQALLQTAIILPVGFVLGWLFLRHGMAGAIGGHVTYNGLLMVLALLASALPEPA